MEVATELTLVLDESTHELRAVFHADADASLPDAAALAAAVAARGWTPDALEPRDAAVFLDRCRDVHIRARAERQAAQGAAGEGAQVASASSTEGAARAQDWVVDAVVGAVQDGSFELALASDRMAVRLILHRPRGGQAVSIDAVRARMAEMGVIFGVDEAALTAAVSSGHADSLVVARGMPPSRGTPTRFENLLDALRPNHDDVDENARVDYREMGNLLLVSPGMPLMRRTPAKQGEPGLDVLGEAVPPLPVVEVPYAANLSGVTTREDDPGLLVAGITGVPVVKNDGISINPLVEVDAVDLVSGNIVFEGTIQVRGDIKAGMLVRVGGDVVVRGLIEGAQVEAGGNVIVTGGILGAAESAASGARARISCRGSVQARFIQHATVNAGVDIRVEREVLHSDVAAGGSILVGAAGASQGNITGGRARAWNMVRAATLGSSGEIATWVQVGINPHADSQKIELDEERKRVLEEKSKLEKILVFLQQHPQKAVGGLGERSRLTYAKLVADLADVEARDSQLAASLISEPSAVIEIGRRIFAGVTLVVGKRQKLILDEQVGGKARAEEDEVVIR